MLITLVFEINQNGFFIWIVLIETEMLLILVFKSIKMFFFVMNSTN